MRQKPLKYFLLSVIVMALLGFYEDKLPEPVGAFLQGYSESDIELSAQRREHILFGDETGGGHKHGVGKPCKSEFPETWDNEKIIETTKRIASNDNARWRQEDNGYFVTEQIQDDVKVRVVLDGQKRNIITSYPINVPRNPCPYKSPANNNYGNR